MSTSFYLKSIEFENYRGFDKLKIVNFKRINLIGGFNGTGKTTLLETIFLIADRRNPMALGRHFLWRKMSMAGKGSLDQYFFNLDDSKPVSINAVTNGGVLNMSLAFAPPPPSLTFQVSISQADGKPVENPQNSLAADTAGLHIESTLDGKPDDASYAIPQNLGMAVNLYRVASSKIPPVAIITPATRNNPQEDAGRFSELARKNQIPKLLKSLSIIRRDIVSIQLLQDAQQPTLYAQNAEGQLFPFALLGDGVQTILSIALTIMNCPGGIVLLDEFEAAIHYSVMPQVWTVIADLANQFNCQIFAVTHSRECVEFAVEGIARGSRPADLQYIRLEKNDSKLNAIYYNSEDLSDSLNADWEIR